MFREISELDYKNWQNFVIVCHGLFMRLFVTRFLKLSIGKFDLMAAPKNCEIWIFERDENGKYKLQNPIKEDANNAE